MLRCRWTLGSDFLRSPYSVSPLIHILRIFPNFWFWKHPWKCSQWRVKHKMAITSFTLYFGVIMNEKTAMHRNHANCKYERSIIYSYTEEWHQLHFLRYEKYRKTSTLENWGRAWLMAVISQATLKCRKAAYMKTTRGIFVTITHFRKAEHTKNYNSE